MSLFKIAYKATFILTLLFILVALITTVNASGPSVTSETSVWEITNIESEIHLTNEDRIEVEERIETNFFVQKHGIYRDIPYKYRNNSILGTEYVDIDVHSVRDQNDNEWIYEVSKMGDFVRIKIGDPNQYIQDEQTFIISYSAERVIGFYDDHDEIYWNVTGDRWPVNIISSSVTIYPPPGLDQDQNDNLKYTCYTGQYGSTSQDCTIFAEGSVVKMQTDGQLNVTEGLTAIVGYPKGIIEEPSFLEKYGKLIFVNLGIFLPFFALPVAFMFWYRNGKDPKGKGTIVPQFDPPDTLSAAEVGVLIDNTADDADISATVIDLAIRGYIQIEETPKKLLGGKSYIFHLKNSDFTLLSSHEKLIMEGIFGYSPSNGATVKLKDLENKFYKTVSAVKSDLYETVVTKGYFSRKPKSLIGFMVGIGLTLIIGTFFIGSFLITLGAIGTILGIIVSGIIFLLFAPFMSQRTSKGTETYEYIKGMTMYMEIAEKDRLDVLQGPDSEYVVDRKLPKWDVKLFEKLLPYAMVLKVEQKWAGKFKDIYKEAPEWYTGGNWNTFNTLYFMNSLTSATSTMSNSFTSSPRSSGSGFSSGGGFSGGGSGGGGGGSW